MSWYLACTPFSLYLTLTTFVMLATETPQRTNLSMSLSISGVLIIVSLLLIVVN